MYPKLADEDNIDGPIIVSCPACLQVHVVNWELWVALREDQSKGRGRKHLRPEIAVDRTGVREMCPEDFVRDYHPAKLAAYLVGGYQALAAIRDAMLRESWKDEARDQARSPR